MWDVNCEEGRICTRQDALARGGIEAAHAVATGATLLCGAKPDDESQQKQRRGSHRHRQTLAAWAAVRASGRARRKLCCMESESESLTTERRSIMDFPMLFRGRYSIVNCCSTTVRAWQPETLALPVPRQQEISRRPRGRPWTCARPGLSRRRCSPLNLQ